MDDDACCIGSAPANAQTIGGNAMLMVFRNDYAVRMLAASVPPASRRRYGSM